MAYTSGFSAVTGAVFTAAQYNTNVRDNFTAIWVYTTAGDISYATGATTLARLAKPSVLSFLTNSSSGVPAWASAGLIHKFGYATSTTVVSTTSVTGVDITGLTFNLTTTQTCTIVLWMFASVYLTGGTATQASMILGSIGGTNQTWDNSTPRTYSGSHAPIAHIFRRTGVTAGTITCKALLAVTDGSRTANTLGGTITGIAITE